MKVTSEKLENNMAVMTITVPADKFTAAVKEAYEKEKNKYDVPGFRKGHAPQFKIEATYGKGIFFETAANKLIDDVYPDACKESGLDIVSRPELDIPQIENGKDFIFTAKVATRPEINLGEYKGITIKRYDESVNDDDIDERLKLEQEKNARLLTIEDRAAKLGDIATIDFDGSVDGVRFEGGKGEDYPLELGSGAFIPGYEDQIVGHKTGETFDVNVTFPEDYQAANLAGRAAKFITTIKELKEKELPELNDDFASEISEFDTLDEYKADIVKKLAEQKAEYAKIQNENAAVDKITEESTTELPEMMIQTRLEDMINEQAQRMMYQGINFQQYMDMTGATIDTLKDQLRPEAMKQLKSSLVLEAIAKKENIEATDDDVEAEMKKMAEQYGMELDEFKKYYTDDYKESMKENLKLQKAIDLIMENVKYE